MMMISAETKKSLMKLRSLHVGDEPTWEEARAICQAVLNQYWNAIQSPYRRPWEIASHDDKPPPLPARAVAACHQLGAELARMSELEAGYALGTVYAGLLPKDVRTRFGVFYTPPGVACRLIELAEKHGVDWETARILDPACGGGVLVAAVAARMKERLGHLSPKQLISLISSNLSGFEIDPFSAWMSQVFTETVLLTECRKAKMRVPPMVQVTDALDQNHAQQSFDLVIGNPPYGKVRLDQAQRTAFQRSLFGHANLYGLFTDQAVRLLSRNGVLAFVTPTSFLAGEYFKNLRALLHKEARPQSIDFIETRNGVFDTALQEALLLVCQRDRKHRVGDVQSLTIAEDGTAVVEKLGRFTLPASVHEPWLMPREKQQQPLARAAANMSHRLSDIGYRVKTGPLVWNRHKDQLREKQGANCYPLIWAEAVLPEGGFRFRAEKRNHRPYIEVWPHQDWLVTTAPCALLQRTTAKEQHRRLIAGHLSCDFIASRGGVVIENHLNLLQPTTDSPIISAETLIAILNSDVVDRVFRCISGSVAVSAYELEALPLPDPQALIVLEKRLRKGTSREWIERFLQDQYRG